VKPELLLMKAIYAPAIAELEREFIVHRLWTAPEADAYVRGACGNVRAAITTTPAGFSRRDFEALPRLEILACFGPYYDLLDLAAARERGVAVTYTPDSTAEPVADLAMGMIVAVMRRLCEADRYVRAGKWPAAVFDPGRDVRGKTCGIVGFGRIGREVAKRAAAFDMRVSYHGPRRKDGVAYPWFADLEDMARRSDVLVVTCPATPATRNLVDARILAALGPDGFLINVARGAIVDEAALIAALESGHLGGAYLDVFENEPLPPESPLWAMPNVLVCPHSGSTSDRENERITDLFCENLRRWQAGEPLLNVLDVERGY